MGIVNLDLSTVPSLISLVGCVISVRVAISWLLLRSVLSRILCVFDMEKKGALNAE